MPVICVPQQISCFKKRTFLYNLSITISFRILKSPDFGEGLKRALNMYDCVHQQKVIFRLRLFLILREYLTPRLRCFVSNCKNIKSRLSRFCHSCMIKQPSGKWKQNFNSAMGASSQSAANITSTILLVSEWLQSKIPIVLTVGRLTYLYWNVWCLLMGHWVSIATPSM